ncbi:hypothetical protein MMC21_006226 [Puttea exsequens]|nr:hypothetical protein [Puttea exsequens]
MRLLNTSTLQLHEFIGDKVPDYAILSHTWGDEEVLFQDLPKMESRGLAGFPKISGCCSLAASEGWQYVWIDTCCIDKSSSAELSEAINSMYRWYELAQVCYVYLVDISIIDHEAESWLLKPRFAQSRWFTRGWTLQELLAPRSVVFYDKNWIEFGSKVSLEEELHAITGIKKYYLVNPHGASIAARMSWASSRETTKLEDNAYCLLGLFGVNMPLLYGEGEKAFRRLQYEIIRYTCDESIFAWRNKGLSKSGMFAQSPRDFVESGDIIPVKLLDIEFPDKRFSHVVSMKRQTPYTMTNFGLSFEVPFRYICEVTGQADGQKAEVQSCVAALACARSSSQEKPLAVELEDWLGQGVVRANPTRLQYFNKPSNCSMISSSPQTYYVQELTVSNNAKQVQIERDLPIFIKMTPAASRRFLYVYRILGKDRGTEQREMIREGTILVNEAFSKGFTTKGMRFLGPVREHGLDLLLTSTAESNGPLFQVYLVDPEQVLPNLQSPMDISQYAKGDGQYVIKALGRGEYLWVALKKGFSLRDRDHLGHGLQIKHWVLNIDIDSFNRSNILGRDDSSLKP